MPPIFVAFYTRGTLYEREADRLRASLDKHSLPHDIRPIDSLGDWIANSRYTATHVLKMMDAYPDRPIVQLDADAVVYARPTLFDDLDCDIAAHIRRGSEMLNGTLYVAPTRAARLVIERYQTGVANHPDHTNEQKWLHEAVKELAYCVNFHGLPASYCWIPDIMADDLNGDNPVIGQMQASRERGRCDAWERRQKWIANV